MLDETDKLLLEALGASAGPTLVYGSSALAAALVATGPVHLWTTSASDHALAEQIAGVTVQHAVALDLAQHGQFAQAVIAAPQSRVLARRWLCEAHLALKRGGALYLGGANDQGIRSLIDDAAAVFGHSHTLLAKRRARVARAVRADRLATPEWATLPGIAPGTWSSVSVGRQTWSSLPGIFSYNRVDPATQLLLDSMGAVAGQRVLDLGCGYGIIGLTAAQRGATVDLVDDNLYAVAATTRNNATFGLNAEVVAADATNHPRNGLYDLVATNPPFHSGKAVDYTVAHSFIRYARRVLKPAGRLLLVANSFIRYDAALAEFAKVERLAQTPSFTVWLALA